MRKRILIVEDNQDMRTSLCAFLGEDGARVIGVGSAEDGIDAVDEESFDIAIVDLNLPGKSGFQLIEYIREQGYTYPLIAMTARDAIVDKIKGFDLGLTDYIVKPFDLLELRARVNAHSKSSSNSKVVSTARFKIIPESFEFYMDGKKVECTMLELRILEILMRNNHALVALDDLIEFAWGDQPDLVNPPVRIHIANIRKKIGDQHFQIIRTIPGVGYIFNDPTERDT
jgi:DNA-binding response OmpR family regulator